MISFIGNAGGYIGMFLGYSLLSLPGLFQSAFGMVTKFICNKKIKEAATEGNIC